MHIPDDEYLNKFEQSKKNLVGLKTAKSEHFIKEKKYKEIAVPTLNEEYELVEEVFPDGSVYKGEKINKMRHGKGKFIYSHGGVYEGDWKNGKMDGYGVLYYADHSIAYQGGWKEDKFEGRGILYNERNSKEIKKEQYDFHNLDKMNDAWLKYEGNFIGDQKEGNGILVFKNGDKISGSFTNDKLFGNCILYKMNGEIQKGIWENNKLIKFL